MDDFNVLSDQDKQDFAYKACLASTTVIGMAVGAAAGGVGAPVGAAGGAAWGLIMCPYISPALKRKFSSAQALSEQDIVEGLRAMRFADPTVSKKNAIRRLAAARQELMANPSGSRSA